MRGPPAETRVSWGATGDGPGASRCAAASGRVVPVAWWLSSASWRTRASLRRAAPQPVGHGPPGVVAGDALHHDGVFGEAITIGTKVASGTQTNLGTLQPGETVSVPVQGLSGVFATCALESTVSCLIRESA